MFGTSYMRSRTSYHPRHLHKTATTKSHLRQGATRRQNATKRSVYGNRTFRNGSRNRNGSVKKSFMGGFFEKFASEIKKL
jgi:hypothetical protein